MDFEEDDKTLWALVGDHTDRFNGQNVETVQGGLIRIVPSREPGVGGYEPATGNMIDLYEADGGMGGTTARWTTEPTPELYAYGLRSPFRGTRDQLGRFWIGDVGEEKFEEVNLVSEAGQNLGWKLFEGPCEKNCDGFVNPLAFYGRGDHPYAEDDPDTAPATKRSIWLGEIYENPAIDRYAHLMDHVVPFGDLFTGWVRGIQADESGKVTMDQFLGHLEGVVSWRVGPDGYAYVLTLDGVLYRVLLDPEAN
jgi:glucose/arabinose dehydrogenase